MGIAFDNLTELVTERGLVAADSIGAVLVTDDTVVHLAAFPGGQVREGALV